MKILMKTPRHIDGDSEIFNHLIVAADHAPGVCLSAARQQNESVHYVL